jgi:hypothetical protein
MGARGGVGNRPGATARPFEGNRQAARGYAAPRGQSGVRSGAYSGYDHGGQTRSYSSRGSASMGARAGGGGGFHGARGGGMVVVVDALGPGLVVQVSSRVLIRFVIQASE